MVGGAHAEVPVFKTTKDRLSFCSHRTSHMHRFKSSEASAIGKPIPSKWTEAKGYHKVDLMLDKGTHLYQLVIDGVEQPDPSHLNRVPNGFADSTPSFGWVQTNRPYR